MGKISTVVMTVEEKMLNMAVMHIVMFSQAHTCSVALAFSAPDTTHTYRSITDMYEAVVRFPDRKPKGIRWMPWLEEAMKDVVRLR